MRAGVTSDHTMPEGDLPWRSRGGTSAAPIPHLVITWSLEEPERIGEALPITGACVVGRGSDRKEDPAPHAKLFQQRPGVSLPMHPLTGSRLSRLQLSIDVRDDGRLDVQNLGQSSLSADGEPVDRCVAGPGTTLGVRNAVSFVVVMRKPVLEPLRSQLVGATRFQFGGADHHGIVGESSAAWQLRDDLAFAATAPGHVFVRGPSGVGKELAARAVHALSSRAHRPLLARNAATFPEGLVDAELFGNVKGYPNAGSPERRGLIGEADGSTLFLDEVGELPPHLQAHLLRVLDAGGEYQRLGDAGARRSDLRLVAATNRELGDLKHDFAARFSLRVEVPGLSARREDIPLLVRHLLGRAFVAKPELAARFVDTARGPTARLDPLLVDALVRHEYTHHLRELDRLLWLALSSSREEFVALTPEVRAELRFSPSPAAGVPAEAIERAAVEQALAAAGGNITRAARALGLKNRFALYRLLKQHGIAAQSEAPPDDTSKE